MKYIASLLIVICFTRAFAGKTGKSKMNSKYRKDNNAPSSTVSSIPIPTTNKADEIYNESQQNLIKILLKKIDELGKDLRQFLEIIKEYSNNYKELSKLLIKQNDSIQIEEENNSLRKLNKITQRIETEMKGFGSSTKNVNELASSIKELKSTYLRAQSLLIFYINQTKSLKAQIDMQISHFENKGQMQLSQIVPINNGKQPFASSNELPFES